MVNKAILIGRLGKDPAIKRFQGDSAVAEFPLATSQSYKNKEGEWIENTDWHNIKLPNKFMADRAEKFLKKGSLIYVEGKMRTRSYDDKDGKKCYITEVVADFFNMLDKKDGSASQDTGSSNSGGSTGSNGSGGNTNTTPPDDDLPF